MNSKILRDLDGLFDLMIKVAEDKYDMLMMMKELELNGKENDTKFQDCLKWYKKYDEREKACYGNPVLTIEAIRYFISKSEILRIQMTGDAIRNSFSKLEMLRSDTKEHDLLLKDHAVLTRVENKLKARVEEKINQDEFADDIFQTLGSIPGIIEKEELNEIRGEFFKCFPKEEVTQKLKKAIKKDICMLVLKNVTHSILDIESEQKRKEACDAAIHSKYNSVLTNFDLEDGLIQSNFSIDRLDASSAQKLVDKYNIGGEIYNRMKVKVIIEIFENLVMGIITGIADEKTIHSFMVVNCSLLSEIELEKVKRAIIEFISFIPKTDLLPVQDKINLILDTFVKVQKYRKEGTTFVNTNKNARK